MTKIFSFKKLILNVKTFIYFVFINFLNLGETRSRKKRKKGKENLVNGSGGVGGVGEINFEPVPKKVLRNSGKEFRSEARRSLEQQQQGNGGFKEEGRKSREGKPMLPAKFIDLTSDESIEIVEPSRLKSVSVNIIKQSGEEGKKISIDVCEVKAVTSIIVFSFFF